MATVMLDTDVYSYITGNNSKKAIPYKPRIFGSHNHTLVHHSREQYAGFYKRFKWGDGLQRG